jgi:hypothetical protein
MSVCFLDLGFEASDASDTVLDEGAFSFLLDTGVEGCLACFRGAAFGVDGAGKVSSDFGPGACEAVGEAGVGIIPRGAHTVSAFEGSLGASDSGGGGGTRRFLFCDVGEEREGGLFVVGVGGERDGTDEETCERDEHGDASEGMGHGPMDLTTL